jgi:hypothetical protein
MAFTHRSAAAGVAIATLAFLVVLLPRGAASAPAPARCPSEGTPVPGSTVDRDLEVDGVCELTNVTIHGRITVEPTTFDEIASGVLKVPVLNGSTVDGGIVSGNGSAVIAGTDLGANLTHQHTTINGPVTLVTPFFFGFADATLRGGVTVQGAFDWPRLCGDCFAGDPLCNDQIFGNVQIFDDDTEAMIVGETREPIFPNGDCTGNTIHGSIFVTNTGFVSSTAESSEIEGNDVTGSVHVDHSTAEVNENTVGGSLLCTNGTVIRPPGSDDGAPGNTVNGRDTCD